MPGLPSAFKASFCEPKVSQSDLSDSSSLSSDRFVCPLNDPLLDFDVIEEWIVEPDSSSMLAEENLSGDVGKPSSINIVSDCGADGSPLEENRYYCVENTISGCGVSVFGVSGEVMGEKSHLGVENPVEEKPDLGCGVVASTNEIQVFFGKIKIEDADELSGDTLVEVKEVVRGVDSDGDGEKNRVVETEGNGSSTSSSSSDEEKDDDASSSSTSSSSSLAAEEEDESDVEEGEIRDSKAETAVGGSEDEEEEETMKGPIRSKNELVPEDLSPVPALNIVLEPHHKTSPVGVVLSIMDTKVIVEGSEKHNPLTEGSILWLTDTRLPLGFVDEIFGPVKNPYYVVRYNSSKEVPVGVQQGTTVSFVPEFANYVLNNKEIYKKGYDASGENDEEILDEVEFSDDEKEAEFRKSQQQKMKRQPDNKNGKQQTFADSKKTHLRGRFSNKKRPVDSTDSQGSEPQALPPVPPLIPDRRHLAPQTRQFVQGNSLRTDSQPSFPSPSTPVYPPNISASQQMPIAFNNLGSSGSFIPAAQPFGVCGQVPNTFGTLGLAHGMPQPGYSGNPPQNFLQQPNLSWPNISCPRPLQQPVFAGMQSGLWNCQSADQPQLGLLGNPSQGLPNFVFSAGLQHQPVSQVPVCMNWQGPMNQTGLNGVPFPGNNLQRNPVGMLNAEKSRQLNANQCIGQLVPGVGIGNSFPVHQFNQGIAPDNGRRHPPKGGNFNRRKGNWQGR